MLVRFVGICRHRCSCKELEEHFSYVQTMLERGQSSSVWTSGSTLQVKSTCATQTPSNSSQLLIYLC